jgi:geranyl-CoA carboxylase alpha subunit
MTTGFIATEFSRASFRRPEPDVAMRALAAVLLFEASATPGSNAVGGWRSAGPAPAPMLLDAGSAPHAASVQINRRDHYTVGFGADALEIEIVERQHGGLRFAVDGLQRRARYVLADGALHLDVAGATAVFRDRLFDRASASESAGEARMLAPMNGRVVVVLVKKGESVAKGQRVVIMEAMKMQHEIVAGRAGIIDELPVKEGDQVATRQLLAALAAD